MSRDVYAETDAYTVEWDPDLRAVVVDWHTSATGDAYRTGMEACLSLVQEEGAAKAMGDCRAFERFERPDREWTLTEWMPRVLETALQYGAVVYPEVTTAQLGIDQVARANFDVPIEQMFAEHPEEARAWLSRQ